MGEAQTPHFYDFGIFEAVTKPQNQHYLSLETPGYSNKIEKKPWNIFRKYYFYKISESGNPFFDNFRKDGPGTKQSRRSV